MVPWYTDPANTINSEKSHGSKGGNARRPKWRYPSIYDRMARARDTDTIRHDSNDSKPNRSKSPVVSMVARTSLHKCPIDLGSKGGKAKKVKWTHLVREYEDPISPGSEGSVAKKLNWSHSGRKYEGSSSPGTKTEGPNKIGTSSLCSDTDTKRGPNIGTSSHKLCSTTGDAVGVRRFDYFVSAADKRSLFQMKPELRRGKCLVCSLVDDHSTFHCPYLDFLPSDAIVSSGCDLICNCCGMKNGTCKCYAGQYVRVKDCPFCLKLGDHVGYMCPRFDSCSSPVHFS